MLPHTRAIATPLPLLSLTASAAAAVLIHLAVASLHGVLRSLAAPDPGDWSWSPLAIEGHIPGGPTPEWAQRIPHEAMTARAA